MSTREFHPLPDELLSAVCRAVGLQALIPSLPASSRLHRVWQHTIERLVIENTDLRSTDLRIITKYANLQQLKLVGLSGKLRAWHMLGRCAPLLPRLTSLIVEDVGAYNSLKTISGSERLQSKLESLELADDSYNVTPDDLRALAPLSGLGNLKLVAHAVAIPDDDSLQDVVQSLTSLKSLVINTLEDLSVSVAAIIPGQLKQVTLLSLSTNVLADSASIVQHQERVLTAAVSSLTSLQTLSSNYALRSAACQRAALSSLQQLTYLELLDGNSHPFVMHSKLQHLNHLKVESYSIEGAVFQHPSLQRLDVGCLNNDHLTFASVAQEHCKITCLEVNLNSAMQVEDADFRHMPTLPHLRSFTCHAVSPSAGRYQHLAMLLRNHSSTLEIVMLSLRAPFHQALPHKLPDCKELCLAYAAVNRVVLHLLAMCKLPSLETLKLVNVQIDDGVVVDDDLGWLLQLPKLRKLRLGGPAISEQVQAGVRQLFGGSEVELDFEDEEWD